MKIQAQILFINFFLAEDSTAPATTTGSQQPAGRTLLYSGKFQISIRKN